jgi:hypothetical protein
MRQIGQLLRRAAKALFLRCRSCSFSFYLSFVYQTKVVRYAYARVDDNRELQAQYTMKNTYPMCENWCG